MCIEQVCFTETKDVRMMLVYDTLNVSHFINEKGSSLVPMGNLYTFISIAIGISGFKVGDASGIETAC